ncbi:hypothetical protein RhiJN_27509 [Ceratobasidium sp. AG-Ba]|nr:hypothetical protein RhiJN_13446 [Ceratobasidium sp. AG-Ba]QRV99490.1 hypothetical protein RhiJN_27509 [Ceratobasidium sp. AG-Ba]QRW14000.1 hypothetical protein RhiLY_12999 [Ceratobasidium sp. AG-Ba]
MPATDPVDQCAAREYKQMLRYYVYSGRTPQSRLDWFEALPKRRPSTPLGLRESIRNVPGLVYTALGPANPADYGLPTPITPRLAAPEPPLSPVPPPDVPRDPQPGEFYVEGHEIDADVSYIVAQGRHSRAPEPGYSAQHAAWDVRAIEERFPGALGYMAVLLFPAGVNEYGQMVDASGMDALLDFVHGWFDLSSRARECGHFG